MENLGNVSLCDGLYFKSRQIKTFSSGLYLLNSLTVIPEFLDVARDKSSPTRSCRSSLLLFIFTFSSVSSLSPKFLAGPAHLETRISLVPRSEALSDTHTLCPPTGSRQVPSCRIAEKEISARFWCGGEKGGGGSPLTHHRHCQSASDPLLTDGIIHRSAGKRGEGEERPAHFSSGGKHHISSD